MIALVASAAVVVFGLGVLTGTLVSGYIYRRHYYGTGADIRPALKRKWIA